MHRHLYSTTKRANTYILFSINLQLHLCCDVLNRTIRVPSKNYSNAVYMSKQQHYSTFRGVKVTYSTSENLSLYLYSELNPRSSDKHLVPVGSRT
jgi:hypothetical protein